MADFRLPSPPSLSDTCTKEETGQAKTKLIKQLHELMLEIWLWLENHLPFANTHGAEFIAQSHWEKFIPLQAQEQLLMLSNQQLVCLPQLCSDDLISPWHTTNKIRVDEGTKRAENDSSGECKAQSNDVTSNDWLETFLSKSQSFQIQNLSILVDMWGEDIDESSVDIVSEAMSVKKLHEVELLSIRVKSLFDTCSADVAVDLGSGKGYLSTELSRCHCVPVLGLDSSQGNTHGALFRDAKLGKKWEGLTRRQQKRQKKERAVPKDKNALTMNSQGSICQCETSEGSSNLSNSVACTAVQHNTSCNQTPTNTSEEGFVSQERNLIEKSSSMCSCGVKHSDGNNSVDSGTMRIDKKGEKYQRDNQNLACECDSSSSQNLQVGNVESDILEAHSTKQNLFHCDNSNTDKNEEPASSSCNDKKNDDMLSSLSISQKRNDSVMVPNSLKESVNDLYVPLTLYVTPTINLRSILTTQASKLCQGRDPANAKLLLTGLHCCGSLSVTALEMFVHDPGVVAVCVVGCCYQLMDEQATQDSTQNQLQFPMSVYGQSLGLHLGRNARNLASQSVQRIQVSKQLQGADFYWRALLDVLMKNLDQPVPVGGMKGMRGLNKRSDSFFSYATAAFRKLGLDEEQVTKDEVETLQSQYEGCRHQLTCFFQLKLALAPVIEALILLDRLLYLLEQDCVATASLIQLFDPTTSPRCFAVVATKLTKADNAATRT